MELNKRFTLIIILLCFFLLSGCDKVDLKFTGDDESLADDISDAIDDNSDEDNMEPNITHNEDNEDKDNTITDVIKPVDNIELLVYTATEDAGIEAVTVLIPNGTEITPGLIVDKTVISMADNSIVIGIESVTTKDDSVIISFHSDKPPLANVGSGMEEFILNALAQSITENLSDYSKVIYRNEGKEYISGHIELGIDEVYFED